MKETLGKRIKRLRKEKKLAQADLAAELEVGRSHVAVVETDRVMPSFNVLCALADFFGVSLDYLRRGDDEVSDQSNQDSENLVSELQKKMLAHSLPPKRLSLISGVNESVIRDILNGKIRRPDVFTVGRLARALQCSVGELIGFSVDTVNDQKPLTEPVYTGDTVAFIGLWEILLPHQRDSVLTILDGIADKTLLSINQNEKRA